MKIDRASLLQLVFPFAFEADRLPARAAALDRARWRARDRDLPVWTRARFADEEALRHVSSYLNAPAGETEPPSLLFELDGATLQAPGGLGAQLSWRLLAPAAEIPFRFEGVRLALFRVGVGFLILLVRPLGDDADAWLDFLHYARFFGGRRARRVRAERKTGKDETAPYFPEAAGGLAAHPDGTGTLGEIAAAVLGTGALESDRGSGSGTRQWWWEMFVPGQALPYATILLDGVAEEETPRLLYRVQNFFHARQELHPGPDDLRPDHPGLLPYADRQWFVYSLDGGAYVACDAPRTPFFRETMPAHVRDAYFTLFLLALHQRFALMSLSEQVSERWRGCDDLARADAFDRIHAALLDFSARGHFLQVMQREHHHRYYLKWQQVFQVEPLFREVGDQVTEMHEYLHVRRTRRLEELAEAEGRAQAAREQAAADRSRALERRISLLGVMFGAPALVFSFLGINLRDLTAKGLGADGIVAALAVSVGLALGVLWWLGEKPAE